MKTALYNIKRDKFPFTVRLPLPLPSLLLKLPIARHLLSRQRCSGGIEVRGRGATHLENIVSHVLIGGPLYPGVYWKREREAERPTHPQRHRGRVRKVKIVAVRVCQKSLGTRAKYSYQTISRRLIFFLPRTFLWPNCCVVLVSLFSVQSLIILFALHF